MIDEQLVKDILIRLEEMSIECRSIIIKEWKYQQSYAKLYLSNDIMILIKMKKIHVMYDEGDKYFEYLMWPENYIDNRPLANTPHKIRQTLVET